jgi:hypothetical protein
MARIYIHRQQTAKPNPMPCPFYRCPWFRVLRRQDVLSTGRHSVRWSLLRWRQPVPAEYVSAPHEWTAGCNVRSCTRLTGLAVRMWTTDMIHSGLLRPLSRRCVPQGQQMCSNGQICPSTSTCCGGTCCDSGAVSFKKGAGICAGGAGVEAWPGTCDELVKRTKLGRRHALRCHQRLKPPPRLAPCPNPPNNKTGVP